RTTTEEPIMKDVQLASPCLIISEDLLPDLGLSVTEAANQLGVSRVSLSRAINGRSARAGACPDATEAQGSGAYADADSRHVGERRIMVAARRRLSHLHQRHSSRPVRCGRPVPVDRRLHRCCARGWRREIAAMG